MKKSYVSTPLFFYYLVLSLIHSVYGADNPDLMGLPEQIGIAFGIGTFAGGILASAVLILMWVVPITILVRGRASIFISMISCVLILSFAVAISWLPLFTLILIVLMIAGLWASKTRGWFT